MATQWLEPNLSDFLRFMAKLAEADLAALTPIRITAAYRGQYFIKRADDGAHGTGRNLGVKGGVLQLGMSQQDLDHADIYPVLQQMGGEAMAQGMGADALSEACTLGCCFNHTGELAG